VTTSGEAMSARPTRPRVGGERELLGAYLDFHRATVLAKLTGLGDAALRRPVPPTSMSPLGLLRHLTFGERYWFSYVFAGDDVDVPQAVGDHDREWQVGPDESVAAVLNAYEAQVVRSREVLAAHGLDELARRSPDGRPHSLRFVMVHVLEETARHVGHLDVLREALDGTTGE
jgi:hypothetical protein